MVHSDGLRQVFANEYWLRKNEQAIRAGIRLHWTGTFRL